MAHDDLEHIPSIVPTRDGEPERRTNRSKPGRGEGPSKASPQSRATKDGGTGLLARLFIAVSLIAAIAACFGAWQLHVQLLQADERIADYATRIGDLESRLSDTDEGMSQNADLQAGKVAELDKEVRKLWDNVWKESKDRFGKLEEASSSQDKSIKGIQGSLAGAQSQMKESSGEVATLKGDVDKLRGDIAELKSIAGDLARLMTSAKANQAEVERVADSLNEINLALAKLDKRVASNEEWVSSINTFRKQVNASLSALQSTQSPPH